MADEAASSSHQTHHIVSKSAAGDGDFTVLQESFDEVTRVTHAIRQVAMALAKESNTATTSSMTRRGIDLCKEVVPSQDVVEQLSVTIDMVRDALKQAACPYRNARTAIS